LTAKRWTSSPFRLVSPLNIPSPSKSSRRLDPSESVNAGLCILQLKVQYSSHYLESARRFKLHYWTSVTQAGVTQARVTQASATRARSEWCQIAALMCWEPPGAYTSSRYY
jgi:hypothetical protein